MEKTTQATIASTVFQLTESAYEKLAAYLERLKIRFTQETDRDEIMRDIESRIAEKLLEKKHRLITDADVASVISEMGDASEIGEDESQREQVDREAKGRKKLYRDTDNAIIAGVASGIANYLGMDPLIIRLVFVASIFFGGTGILVYLLLWFLIPEAATASQKLEMRGQSVTLDNITRTVKERIDEARESGAIERTIKSIHGVVSSIASLLFRAVGKVMGFFFVLGSFVGVVALTIGLGIILTNWNAPYNDFPLREAVSSGYLKAAVVAGYVALAVPLAFIFSLGMRLMSRRLVLPSTIGFGLIGLWTLSIVAAGVLAATISGQYFEYVRTSPEYQYETRVVDADTFRSIHVMGERVIIEKGAAQEITLYGRTIDMDRAEFDVQDGTLVVSERIEEETCLFCRRVSPEIKITVPDLDTVRVEDGVVVFNSYADQSLALELASALVRGDLNADQLQITAEHSGIRGDMIARNFSLNAESSHIEIDGESALADLTLRFVSFQGESFEIEDATITAEHSNVRAYVTGTLTRNIENSVVHIRGTATSTQ